MARSRRSAKVIDLKKHVAADKQYQERLAESLQRLEESAAALKDDIINLTMLGPWREWNAKQPVGAQAHFGPKEILESGDANLAALLRLHEEIRRTAAEVRGEEA